MIFRSRETKLIPIVRAGFIAVLYAAATILLQSISFGPVQVRVADALSPLPYIPRYGLYAVAGLVVGVLIANIVSPFGVYDIILGSLTNLIYGVIAWLIGKFMYPSKIGLLLVVSEEIAITTFFIGYVLMHLIYDIPLLVSIPGVMLGSVVSQGILGYLLTMMLIRREKK
ncbi:MAG: QueT transporter family protein [Sulfolobales archaeon]